MAKNINLNDVSLDSIKIKIKEFKKKISGNYLCIEFGFDYIQLAEAYYKKDGVGYKNVIRKELPPEALEKGIPSEPEAMAQLISKILDEENINLKRTAITLSSESIYTRLVEIPKNISEDKVVDFLLDPSSLIQIPISIEQTDFNIFKTSYQLDINENSSTYFLIAMPKTSINNLIETCEKAKIELLYVESGWKSILRLINLNNLSKDRKGTDFFILLDLLSNCTQLIIIDKLGPIYSNRLTAVRNYILSNETSKEKESKEQYLPISKLDLKVLINEIKKDLNNFFKDIDIECDFRFLLTGPNSSHNGLTKIFAEAINAPTYLIAPSGTKKIIDVKFKNNNFLESNFTKLFGLGLGLLDKEERNHTNQLNTPNNTNLELIEYYLPEKSKNILRNRAIKNKFDSSKNTNYKSREKKIDLKPDKSNKFSDEELLDKGNETSNSISKKEKKIEKLDFENLKKNSEEFYSQDEEKSNNKSSSDFTLDTDFLNID